MPAKMTVPRMTGIESSVADSIARWAADNPEVRRVWVFGSRANDTYHTDSDIDIAVELEPVGDSEETLTRWIARSDLWESQLQSQVAPKVDLDWFDPDGNTPTVAAGLNEAKVLIYERVNS
jgi:predicted nucleotidyltransferase